jgi:hypothetical protein
METYSPIFTITPEILNSAYEIAADLERIDIIREKALTPQLRKEKISAWNATAYNNQVFVAC